jgi:hypothetical protein
MQTFRQFPLKVGLLTLDDGQPDKKHIAKNLFKLVSVILTDAFCMSDDLLRQFEKETLPHSSGPDKTCGGSISIL